MLFEVETVADAYEFLRCLLRNSWGLGDIVVFVADWSACKQLAYALLLDFPDPNNHRDVDRVVMQVKDSTLTLLSLPSIEEACQLLRGQSLMLVTEGLSKGQIDALVSSNRGRTRYESLTEEIFVLADTSEDAARIEALNGPEEQSVKDERLKLVLERGVVEETEMPGVKERLCDEVEKREFAVRNLDAVFDRFDIKLSQGCVKGHIKLDGQDLAGVQTVTIRCELYKHPHVTVELLDTPKAG